MPRKQTVGKYKIKTHKATSKRFRVTGSGHVGAHQDWQKPLAPPISSKRAKYLFSEMLPVKGRGIIKSVHRLAPYLKKQG